ncbi:MAG: hypothetical protein Q9207_005092 [Kuettlingeria erythrocarpa]
MNLNIIRDKNVGERCFPWLWFVRIVQLLLSILILGIAASNAADFSGISCSVPAKLGYNIAASVLSFIVVIVLLLSTGPKPALRVIPWFVWGQLALDAFMFIIWIAAAGVSQYDCNDLCNACSGFDQVWASGLNCYCGSYYDFYYKRDQSPAPAGLAQSLEKRRSRHSSSSKAVGRIALSSIMVVLWTFTLAMTVFWIFKNRKAGAAASTAPTALTPGPGPTQQSGGDAGVVPTTHVYSEKTDAPYTNQPLQQQQQQQQGSYPQHAQPEMQSYPEPVAGMQPNTYATSGPQGAASEYYGQQQPPQQTQAYPAQHAEMASPGLPRDQNVSPVSAVK